MISLDREKLLSELEQKIGYSFRSRALLDRALTHRSFANEHVGQNCQHNEALEFLGDSVLGLVVSAWLLERFPDISEGKLSKMKAFLVSETSLVELAEVIDLGRYILLNRGEEKTGGRRKHALLADAYEALIGVLYIEGGIETAQRFLCRELRDKVMSIDPTSMIGADYKSTLQERLQAVGAPVPEYVVVEAMGPDHRRTFRVELRVSGHALATGEGRTIKLAQQEAARSVLADTRELEYVCTLISQPGSRSPHPSTLQNAVLDDRASRDSAGSISSSVSAELGLSDSPFNSDEDVGIAGNENGETPPLVSSDVEFR
jgi:ribonuclease-3